MKHNLTKNQIEIMKHTVSDRDRNCFGTSKGFQDANDVDEYHRSSGQLMP